MKWVHWPLMAVVTFGTVKRRGDWAESQPAHSAQTPSRCTKCNSPQISGQCTNNGTRMALLYNGPLLCSFNVPIKGLSMLSALLAAHTKNVADSQRQ